LTLWPGVTGWQKSKRENYSINFQRLLTFQSLSHKSFGTE
jgi:hypothetical protein